jgi:hypothetical protein
VFLFFSALRYGSGLVEARLWIQFLLELAFSVLWLYGLTVEMRLLGLLYRRHADRLAWFR